MVRPGTSTLNRGRRIGDRSPVLAGVQDPAAGAATGVAGPGPAGELIARTRKSLLRNRSASISSPAPSPPGGTRRPWFRVRTGESGKAAL
jgi:hypothetical protein